MQIPGKIVEFFGCTLSRMRSSLALILMMPGMSACTGRSTVAVRPFTAVEETVRQGVLAPPEKVSARGKRWVIATQGAETTRIAAAVLRSGGNLVDAAIAASFAISVERPHSTGIGGGGFLIHREGKTGQVRVFDFRERAPALSDSQMFLDSRGEVVEGRSTTGALAVAVPGLVRGLREVHRQWGKKTWASLVLPAAGLAHRGFRIYPALARALAEELPELSLFPDSRRIFLKSDGSPLREGEWLRQKDLSTTLRVLARDPESFYRGTIARRIVDSLRRHGGKITTEDLRRYAVRERKPVEADWNGAHVISMPPPSSGGIHVIQILKMLESDPPSTLPFQSPRQLHLLASAMQQAFADRARFLGDPDFTRVPVERLLNPEICAEYRARFKDRARSSDEVFAGTTRPGMDHLETTHFSMMDAEGNVVVSTQTINGYFGSKLVAEGTGIVLNNEMDDFSAKIGAANLFGATASSAANQVEPGKTPLSSMSPTIVLKDGSPVLALGAPGGTRIITAVVQAILNHLRYGLDLYSAIAAPRIHQQWKPDELLIENLPMEPATLHALAGLGWKLKRVPPQSNVMAVARTSEGLIGVSDPRDAGTAAGE
jgi:gamma-glutamyltranspeptidase/glutathione hydrolase